MSIHQVVTSPSSPTSATFRSSHTEAAGYHDPTGYRESSDFHDRTGYRESSDYHDRTGYRESTDYQERTAQHDPTGYTEHSSHTEPTEHIHPIGYSTGHSAGRLDPAERIEPVVSSTSASSTPPVAMATTQDYADVEKDHSHGGTAVNGNRGGYDLHHDVHDEETALRRLRTAGSLSISPELFEKIYLSPKNQVSNNIRSTVGNPTPLAIAGFLLSLTPLSNTLMGWRGAGGLGAAETGVYYFFGGLLMIVGAVFEFILGNTFPFVVFGTFGAFWFSYGATLTPYFNAAAAYLPDEPAKASGSPQFMATFAFFLVYMGLLCLIYLICALRTNMVFILIFATLVPAFALLASVFWHGAQGIMVPNQQVAAGALTFITSLLGWYLFFVQLLASVDFPLNLPVGDMSGYIKGASERKKAA